MTPKQHLNQLKYDYRNNNTKKYIGFWGNEEDTWEEQTMSNFYQTYFEVDISKDLYERGYYEEGLMSGDIEPRVVKFSSSEQYFMYTKALHFKDFDILEQIIESGKQPYEYKKLGRQVKNYDDVEWTKVRYGYMKDGLRYKYTQSQQLKDLLLATGDAVLVETSPFDKVWGIKKGKLERDLETPTDWENPLNWEGKNLLGFALMDIREELKEEGLG